MRCFVLSLVVLSAAASAGYAQQKSTLPTPGSPDTASGGLRGVYGPVSSAPGQLRGVYGPSRATAATPLSSRLSGSANSSAIPSVSIPGTVREGQLLPEGVQASPMSDRPGYGRLLVNGRSAIVDLSTDRILQFTDSPGQLSAAPGLLQPPSPSLLSPPVAGSSPFSTPFAGSANSSPNYPVVPGYGLPAGATTSPTPYGPSGYGQAFINGRLVLYDLSNNRIVEILR
jgi:hypothetical protein